MLTFLSDPDERHLPMHERTTVWVCDGDKRIATLAAVPDESANRSHQTAMWSAKIHHKQFDPFDHDHEFDEENPNTHVSQSEEGLLSLNNPNKMAIADARQWVRDHYTGGSKK